MRSRRSLQKLHKFRVTVENFENTYVTEQENLEEIYKILDLQLLRLNQQDVEHLTNQPITIEEIKGVSK